MLDYVTRTTLQADIAARLLTNGPAAWSELRERYPQVPQATFWRYVKRVKEAQAEGLAGNSQAASEYPGAESENSDAHAELNFPTAAGIFPDPGQLSGLRASALAKELRSLISDVERLKAYATDSDGRILRPQAFAASIDVRCRVLHTALDLAEAIFDLDHQQRFYDAVGNILLEFVPPESQLPVIEKLEALGVQAELPAKPQA